MALLRQEAGAGEADMTVSVRPAATRDAARIVEMARALTDYEAQASRTDARCALTENDLMRHCFSGPPLIHALVAEHEETLCGYVVYYRIFDTEAAAVGLWMADLFVEPSARGRGIGRALLAALAAACKEHGAHFVGWQVVEENRDAQAFYDRYGIRDPCLSYWCDLDRFVKRLSDS